MKRRAVRPRRDQIAELTRGVRLPLAPIAKDHLEILAEGLREAFDDIRTNEPATVASGEEPEVTALMQARLNRLIQEDSLWRQLVLWVGRGTESISFDGSHLEKRPDLSIVLSGVDRRFPLVAEAKILDTTPSRTIRRFVEGEYAWANREAFMVAYVRDGSLINSVLKPFLSRALNMNPPSYLVEVLPVSVGSGFSDLAYTRHGRQFAYDNQRSPNDPGSISIWHLWLAID